jgi:hypothetical protein
MSHSRSRINFFSGYFQLLIPKQHTVSLNHASEQPHNEVPMFATRSVSTGVWRRPFARNNLSWVYFKGDRSFSTTLRLGATSVGHMWAATAPRPMFANSSVLRVHSSILPLQYKFLADQLSLRSVIQFFQGIGTLLESAVFQMSSTLKKRRSKMNKHKLRKRRKLLRRKSTG